MTMKGLDKRQNMKVCIDVQPLLKNRSGIGWYTYNIVKRIANYGNKDYNIQGTGFDFLNRNNAQDHLKNIRFDKVSIFSKVPVRFYKLLWNVIPVKYDEIFEFGDIYHFFNYIVPPISRDKKVIINVYDMVHKKFPETMKQTNLYLLERDLERSIKRADRIITISENSKKEIIEYYHVDESIISIVTPAIDSAPYKSARNMSSKKREYIMNKYNLPQKYLLFLGTIEPRKNVAILLKAYANLPKDVQDTYKMLLCGAKGWKYQGIDELIKSLDIEENVVYTGYIDEMDKPYIYSLSKLFLFPSLYEGFGMPIVEAMASGVPVITSNTSSMPEAGGHAASYVSPMDYEAITKEIIRLLADEDYYNEKVKLGYENASRFSWDTAAQQTMKIYKELIDI